MEPLDNFVGKTLPRVVGKPIPEDLKFAGWCRAKCKIGEGCKWRYRREMTWGELMKLCPKKSKGG